jgi:hypothetical protein
MMPQGYPRLTQAGWDTIVETGASVYLPRECWQPAFCERLCRVIRAGFGLPLHAAPRRAMSKVYKKDYKKVSVGGEVMDLPLGGLVMPYEIERLHKEKNAPEWKRLQDTILDLLETDHLTIEEDLGLLAFALAKVVERKVEMDDKKKGRKGIRPLRSEHMKRGITR